MKDRTQRRTSGITFRAFIIGLILVVANAHWLMITSEMASRIYFLTFVSLFFNAILSLFVLVLINKLLKQLTPRRALSPQELLVIYIMVVMVSTIGGHCLICFLMASLTYPFRFATPENEWAELFFRYIPEWFTPSTNVLDSYFEGESTLYTVKHLRAWLVPVMVWSAFIAVIWFTLICINSVIRLQWIEKEKLAYPIIQLPLKMATESSSFLKNRGMWLGFAVAGFVEILVELNAILPKIPSISLIYYIGDFFIGRPWNTIGEAYFCIFPFIIGLTFFVPLDISLSVWVFFVIKKAERIIRMGVLSSGAVYFDERAGGAWIAVGLLALWGTRRHFKQVMRRIINRPSSIDDSQEPMKYRTAVIGTVIGMTFLILFSYKAGMTFWIIGGFLFLYFVMAMGVTRVRAEFGPPFHEILWIDPARLMAVSFGPRRVGAANLTILTFYYWLNRLNVAHPMPNQLEAFKIAERARISSKRLVWIMMSATVVGAFACFWAYLSVLYKSGASSATGSVVDIGAEIFGRRLQTWLSNPTGPDYGAIGAIVTGFGTTFFLYFLRHRFFWWPLHPIGYVMTAAENGGISDYWSAVFIGWLIKIIIVKKLGLGAYRRAVPFFLGLVLGDYVVISGASLIRTILFHVR